MSNPLLISDTVTAQHRKEWAQRCADKHVNERLTAALAHKIRNIFPEGDAGDRMFCDYVSAKLDGCRSDTMLDKAYAYTAFTEAQWHRLGGWAGLTFLSALTVNQRRDVLGLLKGPGPFSSWQIRSRAEAAGIPSGRAHNVEAEAVQHRKLTVLGRFIMKLALGGVKVPPEVVAALPASKQKVVTRVQSAAA